MMICWNHISTCSCESLGQSLLCKITAFLRKKGPLGDDGAQKNWYTPSAINHVMFCKRAARARALHLQQEKEWIIIFQVGARCVGKWNREKSFDQICQKSAHSIQLNFNELCKRCGRRANGNSLQSLFTCIAFFIFSQALLYYFPKEVCGVVVNF